jgi:hypothetical protein
MPNEYRYYARLDFDSGRVIYCHQRDVEEARLSAKPADMIKLRYEVPYREYMRYQQYHYRPNKNKVLQLALF